MKTEANRVSQIVCCFPSQVRVTSLQFDALWTGEQVGPEVVHITGMHAELLTAFIKILAEQLEDATWCYDILEATIAIDPGNVI